MSEQQNVLVSPVSIDLGAVNTGLYLSQHYLGDTGLSSNKGVLIRTSEKKLMFSMRNRTAKRHQMRSYKRRKLAKRLFRIILKAEYNIEFFDLDPKEQELLNGFFNRRGFSYYQEEFDTSILNASLQLLSDLIPQINPIDDIEVQIATWATDIDKRKAIRSSDVFQWKKSQCNAFMKANCKDYDVGILFDSLSALKAIIDSIDKSVTEGHKPRTEYLENIKHDIRNSWVDLKELSKCGIKPDELANLIGHISNLQLRCLRKYFNNEEWKEEVDGRWDSNRLTKCFGRYVKAWHVDVTDTITQQKRKEMLRQLNDGISALDLWLRTDPSTSIPPMEDQNNRRPPKCKALLLSETALNRLYPMWRDWLQTKAFGLDERFDALNPIRRLQCIFDRTSQIDVVNIRLLSSAISSGKKKDEAISEQIEILKTRIGSDYNSFLECAGRYYKECEMAAQGTWYPELPDSILTICNVNPPHKKQILNILVGHLLGVDFNNIDIDGIKTFLKDKKVKNTSLLGIARKSAELQKTYGQSFNEIYHSVDKDEADIDRLRQLLKDSSPLIADYLKNPNLVERYSNPFIMAQLYNLLETDPHGFSSTCRVCTLDNALRNQIDVGNQGAAFAKRLPSDTNQPFDGLINKVMKRIAYEIAQRKIEQIQSQIDLGRQITSIIIPIIIEENRFEFSNDLAELKEKQMGTPIDKTRLERINKSVEAQWLAKGQRIKSDAAGLCPYCGEPLEDIGPGEIDHILPRSFSKQTFGVVFNIEPNLIFAHASCNRKKGDRRYTIDNLDSRYLQAIFGTADKSKLTDSLKSKVSSYLKKGSVAFSSFHALPANERNAIRHSLFVEELFKDIIGYLNQQSKTRVNGTQRWLVRHIAKEIRKHFSGRDINITILPYRIGADQVSELRQKLNQVNPVFEKKQEQATYSHIIDAFLAYLLWTATNKDAADLLRDISVPDISDVSSWEAFAPSVFDVHTVKAKPIFRKKDISSRSIFSATIYADHYLSFIVRPDGNCMLGFSSRNAVPIDKGSKYLFNTLRIFLKDDTYSSMDFEEVLRSAQNKGMVLILPFSKTKIYRYIFDNKHSADPGIQKTMNILNSISYKTVKTNVITMLTKGKAIITKEKLNSDFSNDSPYFMIKLSLSDKSVPMYAKGDLVLPSISAWLRLANDPEIAECYGKNVPDGFSWDSFLANKFSNNLVTLKDRAHRPVRKVYSLPIINSPSGGFIARRKMQSGEHLWQILKVDGFAYEGFAVSGDNVDFSEPVVLKKLSSSSNLVAIGDKGTTNTSSCYMDEWVQIEVDSSLTNHVLSIEMAPHSSPRQAFRVTFKRDYFENDIVKKDTRLLPSEVKTADWPKDLVKPRDNKFSVVAVNSESVSVEFISESKAHKKLLNAYNMARNK